MLIETSTVALLLASYVYLWRNHPQADWPPPAAQHDPPVLKPAPILIPGIFTVLVLIASVPVMYRVHVLCRRQFDALERLNTSKPPGDALRACAIIAQWFAVVLLPPTIGAG